jgi:hypothetical protein
MLRVESWSGAGSEDAEAPDGNLEGGVRRLELTVSLHLMVASKPEPPGAR